VGLFSLHHTVLFRSKPCRKAPRFDKVISRIRAVNSSFSGISIADIQSGATLSPSHVRSLKHEEAVDFMKDLKRNLLVLAIGLIVSAGAFGQKRDDDKRPPKPDTKVVVRDKDNSKPPPNNNQDKNKDHDKRGKP